MKTKNIFSAEGNIKINLQKNVERILTIKLNIVTVNYKKNLNLTFFSLGKSKKEKPDDGVQFT